MDDGFSITEMELRAERNKSASLKVMLDDIKDELQAERAKRCKAEVSNSSLEQQVENLQDTNAKLEDQVNFLKKSVDDYIEKYNSLTAESSSSAADVRNLNEFKECLKNVNDEMKEKVMALEDEQKKLLEEKAELALEVDVLKTRKANLDVALEFAKEEIAILKEGKINLERKYGQREQDLLERFEKEKRENSDYAMEMVKQQCESQRDAIGGMGRQTQTFVDMLKTQAVEERQTTHRNLELLLQMHTESQAFMKEFMRAFAQNQDGAATKPQHETAIPMPPPPDRN